MVEGQAHIKANCYCMAFVVLAEPILSLTRSEISLSVISTAFIGKVFLYNLFGSLSVRNLLGDRNSIISYFFFLSNSLSAFEKSLRGSV